MGPDPVARTSTARCSRPLYSVRGTVVNTMARPHARHSCCCCYPLGVFPQVRHGTSRRGLSCSGRVDVGEKAPKHDDVCEVVVPQDRLLVLIAFSLATLVFHVRPYRKHRKAEPFDLCGFAPMPLLYRPPPPSVDLFWAHPATFVSPSGTCVFPVTQFPLPMVGAANGRVRPLPSRVWTYCMGAKIDVTSLTMPMNEKNAATGDCAVGLGGGGEDRPRCCGGSHALACAQENMAGLFVFFSVFRNKRCPSAAMKQAAAIVCRAAI